MLPTIRRTFDSPFTALREFDRMVQHAWNQVGDEPDTGTFPVDVREQGDVLHVEAELPGYAKDQIDVNVEDGVLTISAERADTTPEDSKTHIRERRFTKRVRRFTLPNAYDPDRVQAALADGVLTLTLPKREEVKPRKIEIN